MVSKAWNNNCFYYSSNRLSDYIHYSSFKLALVVVATAENWSRIICLQWGWGERALRSDVGVEKLDEVHYLGNRASYSAAPDVPVPSGSGSLTSWAGLWRGGGAYQSLTSGACVTWPVHSLSILTLQSELSDQANTSRDRLGVWNVVLFKVPHNLLQYNNLKINHRHVPESTPGESNAQAGERARPWGITNASCGEGRGRKRGLLLCVVGKVF